MLVVAMHIFHLCTILDILFIHTVLNEGLRLGNKNGFDPGVYSGIQYYVERGEKITVVHPGGYLDRIEQGAVVLFETTRVEGKRMYWFGKVTNTAFWFVLPMPVDIFEVGRWFTQYYEMVAAHDGDIDQFVDQCELPF